jgi:hypothetical protein
VKIQISFMGPESLMHLRRDFLLALKYGLEDLGHDVSLAAASLDRDRLNIVFGAYFLRTHQIHALAGLGRRVALVNTEVIAGDMVNWTPDKVDLLGAYLPAMKSGAFVWDLVMDNMKEHERYGTRARFLRWGWHPRMEEIDHRAEKDRDYYFFGSLTPRRREILARLESAGLCGSAHHSCPYFVRNDAISRAKVQLNIIQDDRYSHVNAARVCYLANNRCAVVSEREDDPVGYLDASRIADRRELPGVVAELARGEGWRELGQAVYESFRAKPSMKQVLEEALDTSLIPEPPPDDDGPWRTWVAASPSARTLASRIDRERGPLRRVLRRARKLLHGRPG